MAQTKNGITPGTQKYRGRLTSIFLRQPLPPHRVLPSARSDRKRAKIPYLPSSALLLAVAASSFTPHIPSAILLPACPACPVRRPNMAPALQLQQEMSCFITSMCRMRDRIGCSFWVRGPRNECHLSTGKQLGRGKL